MKQTNRQISDDLRRAGLHELAINLKSLRRFTAKPPDKAGFLGFLVPQDMIPHAEEIPIVRQQLLQTGSTDVGELDLHFLGSLRRLAAFQNVLVPRPRGLDHLIHGAVAAREILVGEAEGNVIDNLGFLERT